MSTDTLKIASWNINGVKARMPNLLTWLDEAKPDIACLQEIKSITENFPGAAIEEAGYSLAVHGQKSFNGVALLSRYPLEDVVCGLPGDDQDEQARYIEAVVAMPCGVVRVASIYLPNGNPIETEKFPYKLNWMDRLHQHTTELLGYEEPLVLAGDYNVIPEDVDCYDPAKWTQDALFQPESRNAFKRLKGLGLTDAVRACDDAADVYTFWDYQAGAWPKNNGIRIDHLMLSPQATDRLIEVGIDRHTRGWEKPSDHVPVWLQLDVRDRQPGMVSRPTAPA